jgi:hypothetical protein
VKLKLELIPQTSFFKNLRSELSEEKWDKIRNIVYRRAGRVCEICGGVGPKWPVECHEIWSYDEKSKIQKLEKLIALCPACHTCKHFGLATMRGLREDATLHLMKVNDISREDAEIHIAEEFRIWEHRNTIQWSLDISKVTNFNC